MRGLGLGRVVVMLNGVKTADTYDTELTYGPIGLQWGRGTIKFRKVEIQEL
ncbi:MAG TPA: family 16 glycoside hydrolase [Burkholderiales bacterium]|nr:family 16 glycoside hydrolase [Burkholderiales bacterium]HEX2650495.1 family 16 glycoside hydrolase [Burkholderiales bacterium]